MIETKSGSVLHGRVLAAEEGIIRFETNFAGVLAVKQDQIQSLATDGPLFVALKDGAIIQGRIDPATSGLNITTSRGLMSADVATITAVWREGDKSPAERAAEALARHWTYQLAFDLNGKNGNSDRFFLGFSGRAELQTPKDRLTFSANYARADDEGASTQDEGKGGIDYSNFFTERWSWYVRTELGFDHVKDLNVRSQTAAGIGRTLIKKPKQMLEARAGLSYRFEDYDTIADFSSSGLDLGLLHHYEFPWGKLVNSLNVTPAFEDFSNFVLTHESTLEMPIAQSEAWKLRVGLKNDYTSEPPPGLVEHDWSYLTQMVFTWR